MPKKKTKKIVKKVKKMVKKVKKGKKAKKVKVARKVKNVRKVRKVKAVKKGKKAAKKTVAKAPKMPPVLGKVTHYYDHIGVGVLALKGPLSVGEKILLKRNKQEFTQVVESLQVDHESVVKAKKGDEVGLQLNERIKEGALVYRA